MLFDLYFLFFYFPVPTLLERDPLRLNARTVSTSTDKTSSIIENNNQIIDTQNDNTKNENNSNDNSNNNNNNNNSEIEMEMDPNPAPRVTYLTPPHSEGYGIHHMIRPKPIKFNVSTGVRAIVCTSVCIGVRIVVRTHVRACVRTWTVYAMSVAYSFIYLFLFCNISSIFILLHFI